jgi:hypothetical protein
MAVDEVDGDEANVAVAVVPGVVVSADAGNGTGGNTA